MINTFIFFVYISLSGESIPYKIRIVDDKSRKYVEDIVPSEISLSLVQHLVDSLNKKFNLKLRVEHQEVKE